MIIVRNFKFWLSYENKFLKLFGSRETVWIVNFEKGREYVFYQFGLSEKSAPKRENLTCSGCFELCYVCSDGKRPTPHSSP